MIVLHHLNFSRSSRVLWLLEELGLEYTLVQHERLPGFRAPPSLHAVHASGRAPMVEFDGTIVTESAVILAEIEARHGTGRFLPPMGTDARLRHDEWLHFAEGSLAMPLITSLYGRLAGGLPAPLGGIVARDAGHALGRLEARLLQSPFLAGDGLMLADIQMSYLVELADHLGMLADREALCAYLQRLHAQDGYRRMIDIGGPMMPPGKGTGASA